MTPEQQKRSIHTVDIAGRRRWLFWGERVREIHLQSTEPSGNTRAGATLCGRINETDSHIVIASDTQICPDCVRAARRGQGHN
jgi:hypothetical protein